MNEPQVRLGNNWTFYRDEKPDVPFIGAPSPYPTRSAGFWRFEPERSNVLGLVKTEGPEDGHTFEIRVRSRGSMGVDDGPKKDAKWWGKWFKVRVRAWNQFDALVKATSIPLHMWEIPNE